MENLNISDVRNFLTFINDGTIGELNMGLSYDETIQILGKPDYYREIEGKTIIHNINYCRLLDLSFSGQDLDYIQLYIPHPKEEFEFHDLAHIGLDWLETIQNMTLKDLRAICENINVKAYKAYFKSENKHFPDLIVVRIPNLNVVIKWSMYNQDEIIIKEITRYSERVIRNSIISKRIIEDIKSGSGNYHPFNISDF